MSIAFIYTGQGSQTVGMGKDFYDNNELAKSIIDSAHLSFDVKKMMFEGPSEDLTLTKYAQPSLVLFAIVVTDLLKERGITPSFTAGLSLGEYSACYCSEIFDKKQVLHLIEKRALFMQECCDEEKTSMAAVLGLDIDKCKEVLESEEEAYIANLNCPGQIVIGARKETLEKLADTLKNAGAKRVLPLVVNGAFHTPFMKNASAKMRTELEKAHFSDMKVPVVFNRTGALKQVNENLIDLMSEQIVHPTLFARSLKYMIDNGVDTFVEIGPGSTLAGFVKKIDKEIFCYSIEDTKSLEDTVIALNL